MERKEEAMAAIDALNGTMFKGRQLAVELSKAQPLVNQMVSGGNSTGATEFKAQCALISAFPNIPSCRSYFLHFEGGLLPRPPLSIEHQSQAAVLAAAAAAAAGLPIQVEFHLGNVETSPLFLVSHVSFVFPSMMYGEMSVFKRPHALLQVQQSVHNSFFNTTSFDPTYAALKGITSSKGADGMIYGALASQVYGSVADQVYQDITNHDSATHVEEVETPAGPDPTVLFEAARAKFFQEGQKVVLNGVPAWKCFHVH